VAQVQVTAAEGAPPTQDLIVLIVSPRIAGDGDLVEEEEIARGVAGVRAHEDEPLRDARLRVPRMGHAADREVEDLGAI
jgi:hypothetical protein